MILPGAAACVLSLLVVMPPPVDSPGGWGILRLRGGLIPPAPVDAAARQRALRGLAARPDGSHVVVQLRRTPGPAQRTALAAAGLELQGFLGQDTYFAVLRGASLRVDLLLRDVQLAGVRDIDPDWKRHPALAPGRPLPPWAVAAGRQGPGGLVVLAVFHPDVSLDEQAAAVAARHGAVVRSRLRTVNALLLELPQAALGGLLAEDAVQWIEPPLPALDDVNDSNRAISQAEQVQGPPDGLSGRGVTVLVYDGGGVRAEHPDLLERVEVRDVLGASNHATHVAGTIAGSGAVSAGQYRGMAPAARIESYSYRREDTELIFLYEDPGDMERDYGHAIHVFGADLASNSIGTNTCRNGFDCAITGDYGVTAAMIDAIAAGALGEPFPVLWANGNERSPNCTRCLDEGVHTPEGYHSTAPPACAKNAINVGALNANDDSMTGFSSWGPCDDGRLKPDLAAPGCQSDGDHGVTSLCFVSVTLPDCAAAGPQQSCCADPDGDGFGTTAACGTSMATPTVAGLAALLLEDYRERFPSRLVPSNALIKVLLIQGAVDLAPAGPDYRSGHGSVRIADSLGTLRAGRFAEGLVGQDQAVVYFADLAAGEGPLKITLAWDDPPAAPNAAAALVNDLDLVVLDPAGRRHYPWTLDPLDPGRPAARDRVDRINNVEQVFVEQPVAGRWQIRVEGFALPAAVQRFALCADPQLAPDCNANGIPDSAELAGGSATDCTANGVLDECEPDCDGNGVADSCDIAGGTHPDCDQDGVPDGPGCDAVLDCNGNGLNDACEVRGGGAGDCNHNFIPDECEDCNGNGLADECDIAVGDSEDCNGNGVPDDCDIAASRSSDCNANESPDECERECNDNKVPDDCDISAGTSSDCDLNGVPDECDPDCNANGVADACDIAAGHSMDCNGTGVPDDCELAAGAVLDCNTNLRPDECDIAAAHSADCNEDGVPDDCQEDCDGDGVLDVCALVYGLSPDADSNGVPDECQQFRRVPVDHATLQEAIAAAGEGDVILVDAGVYTGAGNKNLDFGGRNLTVRCADSTGGCIIDCQGSGRGFRFENGENAASRLEGLTIRNGQAVAGGAIHCAHSSPRIVGCTLTDNHALELGGAVNLDSSSAQIIGCVITGNSATFFGGGVNCSGGAPRIERCVIAANHALGKGLFGDGGGLYLSNDQAQVSSCLLVSNSAHEYGGAVYAWRSEGRITQCTIMGNSAGLGGGGLSVWSQSAAALTGAIVRGNSAGQGSQLHVTGASLLEVAYSDVAGGDAAARVQNATLEWGPGNMDADPLLVDPAGPDGRPGTWEDNDYHLAAGSPCIDTGGVAVPALFDALDLDGLPRVLGGRPDMGMSEFPADCAPGEGLDHEDIAAGLAADCNHNWVPDGCDLASGHSADANASGIPDECECAFDVQAPALDHARMCAGGAYVGFPFERNVLASGYIDPRRASYNGRTAQLGIDSLTLIFTEPVYDAGSTAGGVRPGVLTPAGFNAVQAGGRPPVVAAVLRDPADATRVRVEFDRFLGWQEWTTLVAAVEDACGNAIVSAGDLGPGAAEPDRVDIAVLPGDFDQNGWVQPIDVLRFRQMVSGVFAHPCGDVRLYTDVDRSGEYQPVDLLRLRQAVIPIWAGRALNRVQP